MFDLYTFPTPNGRKPAILLEEIGLPYTTHKVDITKGDQFLPDYVALNPNSKIPALTDPETGITVFESGAILIYLAEKTDQFLPTEPAARIQTIQWLMFPNGKYWSHIRSIGDILSIVLLTRYPMQFVAMSKKRSVYCGSSIAN